VPAQPPLERADTVRVITLNLWGQSGDWDQRRSVLIDGLRELRPDLVAFQESVTRDGYDQAADLLGSEFRIVHQSVGLVGDGFGIAVASRWPVRRVHEIDLHVAPGTADFPCATLILEIDAPDPLGPMLFVNHLPNWQLNFEYVRELQTVAAARVIEDLATRHPMHVIVAGDLDADPNAATIRFWTGRQSLGEMSVCYRDAWESKHPDEPGHTYTPQNPLLPDWDWPFRRIDYILVRCGEHGGPTLQIAACDRIFDAPVNGIWASDHFGVMADLALPPVIQWDQPDSNQ
jgi:endonuclease/exonuclease/phosphatase family metal-dependent hydrolase